MSDSYSRAQTRESVESGKNSLEYESFEYESRLDTPLPRSPPPYAAAGMKAGIGQIVTQINGSKNIIMEGFFGGN